MIDYLEILRFNNLGYSQRTIETTAHCSRHTVRSILQTAKEKQMAKLACADEFIERFPDKYKSACTLNRTIRTFTVSWQSVVLH